MRGKGRGCALFCFLGILGVPYIAFAAVVEWGSRRGKRKGADMSSKGKRLLEEAARRIAWGVTVDEVARELGVGREKVLAWMETEEYKGCWRRRYREYVRYLQGLGAASLEEQVRGQDEKLRASAAQAILKLGEMDEEEGGGVKVEFAMEKPV